MNDVKCYAISVATLRSAGAGGYTNETLMIPYELCRIAITEYEQANAIMLRENDKWAKELELAKNEIERLRKRLP